MPLVRRETPNGPVWVRPRFRAEDYAAPSEAVRQFERWQNDPEPPEVILHGRESPFGNYVEVERAVRDGKTWITLLEASAEFAIELEVGRTGFGAVVPVSPERAYNLARTRDAQRSKPVVQED